MGSRQDDMLVCYQGASADSRLYREERKHRNQTRYYPPINVFLIQYLNIFPSNQRKMKLSDKPISIFHCLSLKKWNANAEPEDQSQSQSQDQSENQPPSQKEQDEDKEERHEHYDDTYGTLSEVAAPEPVEPGLSHRPSLERRLSELQRLSDR